MNAPVPCISGHAGSVMGPGPLRRLRTASRSGSSGSCMVDSLSEPEEVVLAPHHALGHAGGAAGVEHVEVVAASAPRCDVRPSSPPPSAAVLVGRGPRRGRAPVPSSTQSQSRTSGTRSRTARCARRTRRGTRPRRRRRCPRGRRARRRCSGSWCSPAPARP